MINSRTSTFVNSIFEQPWWLDAVAPNAWRELTVKEEGVIIARWPIVEIKNTIGMPKLTQTLGFWLSEDQLDSDTFYNQRKRITNLLLEQLPNNKSISINLDFAVDYFLPIHWKNFIIEPKISYRINELNDLDNIYNKFAKIVKRNIKAASNKVNVKEIDDIEILLILLEKTFNRQNMKNPWDKDLIRNIYKACKEHNACKLLYAQDNDGNIYSGNLFVYCDKVFNDLISGTDPKYRSSGAATLLVWEGIKYASGVSKAFNFVGSMIEGVEEFMRQFGGKPSVYYHIHKQKKSTINIVYLRTLQLMKPMIKSLIGYNKRYKNQNS